MDAFVPPPNGSPEEIQAWNNMMDTMVTFIKASTHLMNTITKNVRSSGPVKRGAPPVTQLTESCEPECQVCRPKPPCGVCLIGTPMSARSTTNQKSPSSKVPIVTPESVTRQSQIDEAAPSPSIQGSTAAPLSQGEILAAEPPQESEPNPAPVEAESENTEETPIVEGTDVTPASEPTDENPAAENTDGTPAAENTDDTPAAGDVTPAVADTVDAAIGQPQAASTPMPQPSSQQASQAAVAQASQGAVGQASQAAVSQPSAGTLGQPSQGAVGEPQCICANIRAEKLAAEKKARCSCSRKNTSQSVVDNTIEEEKEEAPPEPEVEPEIMCGCGLTDGNKENMVNEMIEQLQSAQEEINRLQEEMARLQRMDASKKVGPHGGPNPAALYKEIMKDIGGDMAQDISQVPLCNPCDLSRYRTGSTSYFSGTDPTSWYGGSRGNMATSQNSFPVSSIQRTPQQYANQNMNSYTGYVTPCRRPPAAPVGLGPRALETSADSYSGSTPCRRPPPAPTGMGPRALETSADSYNGCTPCRRPPPAPTGLGPRALETSADSYNGFTPSRRPPPAPTGLGPRGMETSADSYNECTPCRRPPQAPAGLGPRAFETTPDFNNSNFLSDFWGEDDGENLPCTPVQKIICPSYKTPRPVIEPPAPPKRVVVCSPAPRSAPSSNCSSNVGRSRQ